jgi:hypothetical protein
LLADPEAVLWGGIAATAVYVAARRALLRVATVSRRVLRYHDEAAVRQRLAAEVERSIDDLIDEHYDGEIHLLAYSFGCSVVLDTVLRPAGEAKHHARVGERLSSLVTVGCPYDAERLFFPDRLSGRESIRAGLRWRNLFVASDLFGSNFAGTDDTVAGRRTGPGGLEVCSIRYLPEERLDVFSIFRLAAFRNHTGYWHDMGGCWASVLDLWGLSPEQKSDQHPPPPPPPRGSADVDSSFDPAVDDRGAVRRAVVFLLALAALLAAARGGVDLRLVTGLFVAYIIAAAIWVRGQYEYSLRRDPWLPPRWLFVLGCAVAVGLLIVYLAWPGWEYRGVILLTLLVLFYVLCGYFVVWRRCRAAARFRELPESQQSRVGAVMRASIGGIVTLGIGLVLIVVGLALLGSWIPGAAALVAVGLLLFFLPAVSVVSEATIVWLSGRTGVTRLAWMLGGALAFSVVTLGALLAAESPLVLIPLVAIGLLVIALASSTQADIAAVLAVLAFMGITPVQWGTPAALDPAGRERVLVALGDSYMSGEGAGSYFEGTDEGGGNACRRAPTSWAAMAGQQSPFDGLFFAACSGAVTSNVRADDDAEPKPVAQPGEGGTQLEQYMELQGDFTPALVVLSLGGNDAGFSTIGQMCLAPGNCADQEDLWLTGLDEVGRSLEETFAEIRETFQDVPVVVIPYPDPIDDGGGCGQIALTHREQTFIRDFLGRLNATVEAAASQQHFHYLSDMEGALAASDLQLCDPLNDGRPGVNFVGLRSVNGDPDQRFNPANWLHNSLHPNERGHAAMLRVFQNWLAENDSLDGSINLPAEAPPADGDPAAEPPANGDSDSEPAPLNGDGSESDAATVACSVYDATEEGCRPRGTAWALGETSRAGLVAGAAGLLALSGVWAASVAFFAWRRRVAAVDQPTS